MARYVRATATSVVLLLLGLSVTPALGIDRPVYSDRISPFPKGKRGFCFKNSCSYPVRVGQTGASTGIPCSEGCPAGTICYAVANLCYFSVDSIRNIGILQPNSERVCAEIDFPTIETRVYVPTGIVKLRVTFSGALYGSSGCDATGYCETAICKECPSYRGPNGPMMQAEMTLQEVDQDYYDVTAIHGANMPMVMRALSPSGTFYAPTQGIESYHCGEPGTVAPRRGETPSSWQFRPQSEIGGAPRYAVVRDTGVPCSASCTKTCGISYRIGGNGGPTSEVKENVCGDLIGVWTDDELCIWTEANPFGDCAKPLPNAEKGGTHKDAYGCEGKYAESCFQRTATAGCCGCTVWPEFNLPYDTTNPCWAESKGWMDTVKTRLQFIKAACPTCYTYPYDDATSLFVCRTPEEDGLNMASYEIEWCPEGVDLTVKTAGTDDIPTYPGTAPPTTPKTPTPGTPTTPKPATPTPATPKPSTPKPLTPTPVTSKPSTPTPATSKPVTPAPATPKPLTPTPFTPTPATSKPVTPTPVTSKPVTPTPVTPKPQTPTSQPDTPETETPVTETPETPAPWQWTPVPTATPMNPTVSPPTSPTSAPPTSRPIATPTPATPTPGVPLNPTSPPAQAAVDDKSSAQNNTMAIAFGVVAVALAVLLVGGVVLGVVFRKKLFGDKDAEAKQSQLPASPMRPDSPREPMYEDEGAASTERLN